MRGVKGTGPWGQKAKAKRAKRKGMGGRKASNPALHGLLVTHYNLTKTIGTMTETQARNEALIDAMLPAS